MASLVVDVGCMRLVRVRNSSRIYEAVLARPIAGAGFQIPGHESLSISNDNPYAVV